MPGPSPSWATVNVHADYGHMPTGAPYSGLVRFTFLERIVAVTDGKTIFPAGDFVEVPLGLDGSMTFACPAVDDPDNTPADWSVRVDEVLEGRRPQTFYIQPRLVNVAAGLDLGDVVLASSGTPAPTAALRGTPGGLAGLNSSGQVVDSAGTVILTGADRLAAASNLSDVANAATSRTNLGLGTAATQSSGAFDTAGAATTAQAAAIAVSAQKSANLSDLASAATARTNLGLGTAATSASTAFDAAGAAAAVTAASAQRASNLSDLTSAATARTNLSAVNAATLSLDATVGANAVVWDGATDNATNLAVLAAAAVTAGLPLRLPPGVGMVGTWAPPSGLTLIGAGSNKTTIRMHPSANGVNTRMLNLSDTTGITLQGLTIDGNLSAFTAVSTEQKHGIYATNVAKLALHDVIVTACKGDGVYIGKGTGHSADVVAYRLRCLANYRNGLTIADLAGGEFVACNFSDTTGTAPQAGVDIEPNDNTYVISDIRFIGCRMTNNAEYGFAATLYPGGQTQERVKLIGCIISGNLFQGVYLYGTVGFEFNGCDITNNTLDGVLFQAGATTGTCFIGGRITGNGHHGINCQPVTTSTVKNSKVIGTTILDNGGATPNTYYGMLWDLAGSTAGSVDGLTVQGVTSTNRNTSNQKYGSYFSAAVSNLIADNNDFRGNATSAAIFNDDATTRQRGVNLGVTITTGVASTQTLSGNIRFAACSPTAPITLTLPVAPETNADYTIWDDNGTAATNTITIVPSGAHTFANVPSVVLNTASAAVRMFWRSNKWYVTSRVVGTTAGTVAAGDDSRFAAATGNVFGIVRTPVSVISTGNVTVGSANTTRYFRVLESGTISKIRLSVGVASGNICVAAYSNTGTGLTAAPGTRVATSGSIACPATGINDVSLGGSVALAAGDWLSIGADNATATFAGATGGGDSTISGGQMGSQAVFPAPTTGALTPGNNRMVALIGVP